MTVAQTIGLLHPGAMGVTIGAAMSGRVVWASDGRSTATTDRARAAGLEDVGTVDELVSQASVVVSVCPPAAAEDMAADVSARGFDGLYVDANAVSPATARRVGSHFDRFVDGGIIGPPAHAPDTTRLYLSGDEATAVADLYAGSNMEARVVDGGPGAASAVKMCFAAWTKGSAALLLGIQALAESEGVTDAIVGEWATSMPDLTDRAQRTASGTGPKAWRFEGEMHEIADTFAANDLPDGFHRAAAEIYHRLGPLKNESGPTLGQAIELMLGNAESG